MKITVPTTGLTATQAYTYDALNRLKSAVETNNLDAGWKQTFEYDRYGNRTFNEGSDGGGYLTTTFGMRNCSTSSYNPTGICNKPGMNPTIGAGDNRLIEDQDGDQVKEYEFDASGNTKRDAAGRQFFYDAENKQTLVKNASDQIIGQYYYDGDGKRVKKVVPNTGETTVFIYDASGKMVAEYSTQTNSNPKISYLTSDHLGSPRINTDAVGAVTARHDYQPFGEEIQRASYGADDVRKQFATYERDKESDLDFAQARYFNSGVGRFSSADEFRKDSNLFEPQSWNKYIYVKNNPLIYIDPKGEKGVITITGSPHEKTAKIRIKASFGFYVKEGNISKKELKRQMNQFKKDVVNAYKGTFEVNGQQYTITDVEADITVKTYKSESAAIKDGQAGKVDNIVGIVEGETIQDKYDNFDGHASRNEGENFDRMLLASNARKGEVLRPHEVGHIFGARGHLEDIPEVQGEAPPGLMSRNTNVGTPYLTALDFSHIFENARVQFNNTSAVGTFTTVTPVRADVCNASVSYWCR